MIRLSSAFACAVLLVGGATVLQPASQDSPITWRADFEQARSESRQTGKPLLVCFR